ncbi:uncharacterized protein LOC108914675 [Anoplophora glabripennis]|uniref:uncharacterized protein LOC108914675 n=1 Tax=Anoplophora glabripennis TaxID=217634 RepID=UPI000C7913F2|nr:uncharacterized protein LOC108914675 [Anoplophora glabripennis]
MLPTSIDCALPNQNEITPLSSNRWNLKKRKRTTVTAMEKKNNAESFQTLMENKINLINIQKDCYKVELSTKEEDKTNRNEEWQLKQKILALDIQIKEEQYNELKEERARKRTLFSLQEEEQKIKIEILKSELNMKLKQSLGLS